MTIPDLPPISTDLRDRLKEDVRRRGILVPVILAQDGEILDGQLRLEIAEELGLTQAAIPKIVVGRLSQAERGDLRVVLNLCRRQLTQAQVRELIAWELRRDPHASDRSVARKIGVDHTTVGGVRERMEAAGEIRHLPTRAGSDGKIYRKPIVMATSNAQAIEAQVLLGELGDDVPDGPVSLKKLRRMRSARERAEHLDRVSQTPPDSGGNIKVFNCDFRHLGNRIAPGSVDFAVVDPPWGNDFAEQRRPFAETIFSVLKADGILACYTGVAHMPEFIDVFREAGLKYEWTIVGKRRVSSARQRNLLINRWVPIVVCRKGRFRAASPLNDMLETSERDKTLHAWQQPLDEAAALVRALSRPGALIADLCVGSGTTPAAVALVGEGRRFQGCEADARLVEAARSRVTEVLRGETVAGAAIV